MIEPSVSFRSMSEEFVELSFRHDPIAATDAGIHDYDHLLPDHSPEGYAERAAWLQDFDRRLSTRIIPETLDSSERIDYALLKARVAGLQCELEHVQSHTHNPVRFPERALHGIFLLMARPFAPLDERKEAVLARLMAVPDYLDKARRNLEQVPEYFARNAADVTARGPAFVDEVVRTLVKAFPGEAERIEHSGERARMGFLRYLSWIEQDLRKRTRGGFAIGEELMNWKLQREHLLEGDCASIERLGHEHIERTRARLEEEARRIDPTRSWREQIAAARTRHPEPLRLRDAYMVEIDRARRFVEQKKLAPILEGKLEVIDTPVFERPTVPFAAYLGGAPFDYEQFAFFYVTPVDPARPPDEREQHLQGHCYATLPLIALHEAYPGHHLQVSHANRIGSRLRRLTRDVLLAEGWALYCEELMADEGFFSDPVTRLFQLRDLLWRACRVVIDVGLQTGRMTPEQAALLLVDEAMLSTVSAESEIRWYAQSPTEPLSYLVGKQLLLEMRAEARNRLGARFNLHEFHSAVLSSGNIPPALVRQELFQKLETAQG